MQNWEVKNLDSRRRRNDSNEWTIPVIAAPFFSREVKRFVASVHVSADGKATSTIPVAEIEEELSNWAKVEEFCLAREAMRSGN